MPSAVNYSAFLRKSYPFHYIAGGWHSDHDTIANFRRTFLLQIAELFGQILLMAQERGVLKLKHISLDGSKIHADASKSKAVSYQRLLQIEEQLQPEVAELGALREQTEPGDLPKEWTFKLRSLCARKDWIGCNRPARCWSGAPRNGIKPRKRSTKLSTPWA